MKSKYIAITAIIRLRKINSNLSISGFNMYAKVNATKTGIMNGEIYWKLKYIHNASIEKIMQLWTTDNRDNNLNII